MTLIEFNDKLLVNKGRKLVTPAEFTQEEVNEFRRIIAVNAQVKALYNTCEDSKAFLEVCPWLKRIYGLDKYTELFYASKLKAYYKGVPCKLTYILNRLFDEFGNQHINTTVAIGVKLLTPYVNDIYNIDGQEATLKDLIDNYAGHIVKLLTKTVRKVKSADCYELYVNNVDRVALIPNDIANMLPYDMCAKLSYEKMKGLFIDDLILRTLNDRLGVTKDDFDLRKCV